ncbi:MAG TPA: L-lactate permease [Candidatus Limnocylindrales bacterium]|jgi:lactate permease|nr:L-lactate permease [Candidatus Limnocylindrales bacterium]
MTGPSATSKPSPPAARHAAPSASVGWAGYLLILLAIGVSIVVLRLPELTSGWRQGYDPLGHWLLSTVIASLPVVVLLGALAFGHTKAHYAALAGLVTALLTAIVGFHMPARMAAATTVYGLGYGLFPIGWIVLNVIFLYQLTVEAGRFEVLKHSLTGITQDRRLQLLLIAFCFGAFFEGAAGFGTPVAVTAALLIGLGFRPLQASGLSLIANTAPVAFGALGTPIIALAGVTGFSEVTLGAMVGRILALFALMVPFWLIWAFTGFSEMLEVWPAVLVAGASFATTEFLVSNYHGPWLAGVISAVVSMICLIAFLQVWHPKRVWTFEGEEQKTDHRAAHGFSRGEVARAWLPWLILSVIVFCWGTVTVKKMLNTPEKVFTSMATWSTPPSKITSPAFPVHGLNKLVERTPPVVIKNTKEPAVFNFNWLSATGTGIFIAAILSGLIMGFSVGQIFKIYLKTIVRVRFSLVTISAMMAVGFLTRYAGLDATMGLAFARTGHLYPFFGTLLGWMGVALTGSDTSSNVLFGSLQKISAQQVGVSPVLMASANSAGGVMGKMIDAQSIVVASTATEWYGHEGDILRYVFFHSIALACLVGIVVFLMAYVAPFTHFVLQ